MPSGTSPRTLGRSLLFLLAVAILPLLVVHTALDLVRARTRRDIELQANLEVARALAKSFDVYVQEVLRRELVVGQAFISPDPVALSRDNALLQTQVEEAPSLHDLVWAGPGGRILASTVPAAVGLDIGSRPYFQRIVAGEGWAVSSLLPSPVSDRVVFVVARGLRDEAGELLGVVAGLVDPQRFGEVFRLEREREGAVALLDGEGTPVYRYPEVAWTREAREQLTRPELAAGIIAGTERTGTFPATSLEERSVYGAVPVRSAGWLAVASRPEAVVMGPVVRELAGDAIAVLLAGLAAFLVSLRVSRTISRPVEQLDRWLTAIGRGEMGASPDIDGPLELRRLGGAVERMSEELRNRQEEHSRLLDEAQSARADAEATRQETANLLESITDGFFALDPKGRFTYLNREAERLLRGSRKELLGRQLREVFPEALDTRFQDAYLRLGKTGIPEVVLDFYPPFQAWFEAHLYPSAAGSSVFFQDVTVRVQAELEIRRARDAAENANRAKDEFLANISHEIRTPMNAVLGLTQLVLQEDLSPEQHRHLSMVQSNAQTLMGLIDDILDFSKIESGGIHLAEEPFCLREMVERTVQNLALRAHEKGLEVVCDLPREADTRLVGDPTRLRQVLVNLVGNAIKFTERGELCVTATTERLDGDEARRQVCLVVSDTGIGIPSEKIEGLFRKFSQVDSSLTREHGGTGLGLAISQQIARAMEGEIVVESTHGTGSVFTLRAPFGLQPQEGAATLPEAPRATGIRVLVADDSAGHRGFLSRSLTGLGAEVQLAVDGAEALRLAGDGDGSAGPFDLVLLDAEMPGMDGFQVAERLQHGKPAPHRLALMIASTRIHDDMARCRRMGLAACLVKPIRHAELSAVVCGDSTLDASEASVPGAPGGAPRPRRPPVPANILLAEDNRANRVLVQTLLEKRGWRVVAVTNGREALDALESQTFDLVLMDAQMPVMDGYEATRLLRRREAAGGGSWSHTPVICVTAHAMRGDRERCLDAGMDGYLPKPIDAEELYGVVEEQLGARAARGGGPPPADLEKAVKRIQGDWELFRRLAESYLAEYPGRLQALVDGVRAGDCDRVQRLAHGLKGMFAMFEANPGRDAAVRIEALARDAKLDSAGPVLAELKEQTQRLSEYLEWAAGRPPVGPAGDA